MANIIFLMVALSSYLKLKCLSIKFLWKQNENQLLS